jgi:subtilase-type serine protease
MRIPQELRRSVLASAIAWICAAPSAAMAADIVVASGTTKSDGETVGGTDHLTVEANGRWVANDTVIKWKNASTAFVIDNDGLIESTEADGRAINASGSDTSPRNLVLNNNAGATIQSENDAFRINIDITGGNVVVNNAGSILSTVSGQALDFDSLESTSAGSVIINNLAGGLIKANGADAIRPGAAGTVNNAGTIYSDGVIGDSNDGIDFQAHGGTVVNLAGGLVSGQRHGITGSGNLDVFNAAGATIIGRNGSGVGSDGTGKVVNYGTITGAYVGTGDGDGDGVDIDFYGEVDNYGLIQGVGAGGVGKDGQVNDAEGVAITGGGVIRNHAGGTIQGAVNGITAYGFGTLVDGVLQYGTFSIQNDGAVSGGYHGILMVGQTTLVNTGTITSTSTGVAAGEGDAFVENAGYIQGGDYAIQFGAGNDTLAIDQGSRISGAVDGGAGTNTLWLRGGSFDTASNFQLLRVSGDATLAGDNTFASASVDGTLRLGSGGTTGSLGGAPVSDQGLLVIDHGNDFIFDSLVSGTGGLEQAGTGHTTLTAASTYTGATTVANGTLTLATGAAVGGDATVRSGAVLDGGGHIGGSLTVGGGGVLETHASTSGGSLSIGGNVMFAGDSTWRAVLKDGVVSPLVVGGGVAIASGSAVVVTTSGSLAIGATTPLLTATGGVSGQFGSLTTDTSLAFLNASLVYSPNGIGLALARNELPLASVATTRDQASTGAAIDTLDVASPVARAVLQMAISDVPAALSDLSGEGYASARSGMLDDARQLRDAVDRHLAGAGDPNDTAATRGDVTAWASTWGSDGHTATGASERMDQRTVGGLVGADIAVSNAVRVGALAGHSTSHYDIDADHTRTRTTGTYAGLYASGSLDAWQWRAGLIEDWLRSNASRHLATVATGARLASHYDGTLAQAFAEAGYRIGLGDRAWLEPFAGIARASLDTDHASEGANLGALEIQGKRTVVSSGLFGVNAQWSLDDGGVRLRARLLREQSWGDVDAESRMAFAGSDSVFTVSGTPLARHTNNVDLGLDIDLSSRTHLDVSYTGEFAPGQRRQGGRLGISVDL